VGIPIAFTIGFILKANHPLSSDSLLTASVWGILFGINFGSSPLSFVLLILSFEGLFKDKTHRLRHSIVSIVVIVWLYIWYIYR
jgi:hypothetical protein